MVGPPVRNDLFVIVGSNFNPIEKNSALRDANSEEEAHLQTLFYLCHMCYNVIKMLE